MELKEAREVSWGPHRHQSIWTMVDLASGRCLETRPSRHWKTWPLWHDWRGKEPAQGGVNGLTSLTLSLAHMRHCRGWWHRTQRPQQCQTVTRKYQFQSFQQTITPKQFPLNSKIFMPVQIYPDGPQISPSLPLFSPTIQHTTLSFPFCFTPVYTFTSGIRINLHSLHSLRFQLQTLLLQLPSSPSFFSLFPVCRFTRDHDLSSWS